MGSDATKADAELIREMDEYLDLYGDDEPVDGSRELPVRGGAHRREQG